MSAEDLCYAGIRELGFEPCAAQLRLRRLPVRAVPNPHPAHDGQRSERKPENAEVHRVERWSGWRLQVDVVQLLQPERQFAPDRVAQV